MSDYATAVQNLQENLVLLSDGLGNVPTSNQPLWNLSNAMLVVLDALEQLQREPRR